VFIQGCSPTYPSQKDMIEGVKRLCKTEYSADVDVKIAGKTMAVYMPIKNLFDLETMQVSEEAFKKVDGVMLSVSRVALSGSKEIDFYTIVAADEDVPGAEVILTRYVRDLRRFMFRDISVGEFSKRLVFDIRFNPQAIIDKWTGGFTAEEITLNKFICEQAARRLNEQLRTDKNLSGKFKLTQASGSLQARNFVFNVDIMREGLPMSELIHGKSWHEDILFVYAKTIAHVLWAYSFQDYDKVIIENKFDSKRIEIGKAQMEVFRKKKILIN